MSVFIAHAQFEATKKYAQSRPGLQFTSNFYNFGSQRWKVQVQNWLSSINNKLGFCAVLAKTQKTLQTDSNKNKTVSKLQI